MIIQIRLVIANPGSFGNLDDPPWKFQTLSSPPEKTRPVFHTPPVSFLSRFDRS